MGENNTTPRHIATGMNQSYKYQTGKANYGICIVTAIYMNFENCTTTLPVVYDAYICSNHMKICMRMINIEFRMVFASGEGGKKKAIDSQHTEFQLHLKYFTDF